MKQISYFLFSLVLLLPSCARQKSFEAASLSDVSILIDLNSVETVPLKLGNIRYVPLETSDECLIGRANKVLVKHGKIYVADFYQAMSLFVFDLEGKFLFKIARRGQGPNEYISFRDFDIHSNGDIYILDNHGQKIMVLNSEEEQLRQIKLEMYYPFSNLCVIDDKMYWAKFMHGKRVADLGVYDMENEQLTFLLKDEKFLYDIHVALTSYKFYYSPENTYYSPPQSEIIYALKSDGIYPAIGIKNLPIPPPEVMEEWERNKETQEFSIIYSSYFLEGMNIYETDYFISIGYTIGMSWRTLLYDKRSNSARIVLGEEYFYKTGSTNINGSTGKEFFNVVSFDPDNVPNKRILESREELKNWSEEDNPVISFFTLDM